MSNIKHDLVCNVCEYFAQYVVNENWKRDIFLKIFSELDLLPEKERVVWSYSFWSPATLFLSCKSVETSLSSSLSLYGEDPNNITI